MKRAMKVDYQQIISDRENTIKRFTEIMQK
jgi:hypothetical protein